MMYSKDALLSVRKVGYQILMQRSVVKQNKRRSARQEYRTRDGGKQWRSMRDKKASRKRGRTGCQPHSQTAEHRYAPCLPDPSRHRLADRYFDRRAYASNLGTWRQVMC